MSAPQPHWLAQLNHAPELEALADERAPRFAADERTRGVSTLRAQSRCAFRGFAETRLMTETLERPVPGFNERERGEILHHALERIWSELRDSRRLAALGGQQRAELLDHSARSAVAASCRRRDPGARWRERERIRLNGVLSRWLQIEAERSPFEVESLEGIAARKFRRRGVQRAHRSRRPARGRRSGIDRLQERLAGRRLARRPAGQSAIADLCPVASAGAGGRGVWKRKRIGMPFVAEAERRGIFKRTSQRTGWRAWTVSRPSCACGCSASKISQRRLLRGVRRWTRPRRPASPAACTACVVSTDPYEVAKDGAARRHAVAASGSVLVQAPAGSGKTTLLVQRYLSLLASSMRRSAFWR